MDQSLFLEDFAPGQRFVSDQQAVTEHDLETFAALSGDRHPVHLPGGGDGEGPVAHGPLGIARYFGAVFDHGLLADTLVGALDVHWKFRRPLRVGVPVHYETLVTGWRRSSSNPERGIVFRHIWLKDAQDRVIQEGSSAVIVLAARPDGSEDPPSSLPLGLPWAHAVIERLEDASDFHDATQLFDGTIGLASDLAEVQLRVYKGQVIDVARRTPRGATFTVNGAADRWCELLGAQRNDFVIRADRGEFSVSGDAYTYLQLTKAMHLIIDAARGLLPAEASA